MGHIIYFDVEGLDVLLPQHLIWRFIFAADVHCLAGLFTMMLVSRSILSVGFNSTEFWNMILLEARMSVFHVFEATWDAPA
mmetsp:Transcript_7121/g.14840  ORF Transcript_7121/g.14840 Transcript_7121/m.14840 type:complete len:81 (+) Transcript_7121:1200-1442(+)